MPPWETKLFVTLLVMTNKRKKVYPNLKRLGLTTDGVADILGYKSGSAFRSSTAHTRLMEAMDHVAGLALNLREISDKDFLEYITNRLT